MTARIRLWARGSAIYSSRSDPQNIAYLRAFKRAGYRLTDVETREVDRHGNTKYFLNNLTGIVEEWSDCPRLGNTT